MNLKLYHYWRSSSSWRVRWALLYKNIPCDFVAIDLLKGEQHTDSHKSKNAMTSVPVLEQTDSGQNLSESTAIIEWLEELNPKPSLLPGDSWQRAHIRHLTQIINSGTQPIQNLQVLKYVEGKGLDKTSWGSHWIHKGLKAYEQTTKTLAGKFSVGNELTMADLFLIPQLYNARRFNIDTKTEFPLLSQIESNALQTSSGQAAHADQHKT